MLKTRPYRTSDAAPVAELIGASFPGELPAELSDQENTATAWHRRLGNQVSLVALEDGALVGFVSLATGGVIDCLYTHADWQGQGIGSRLVEAIETAANQLRLPRLEARGTDDLRPFFERIGYRVADVIDDAERSQLRFVKELTLDFSRPR